MTSSRPPLPHPLLPFHSTQAPHSSIPVASSSSWTFSSASTLGAVSLAARPRSHSWTDSSGRESDRSEREVSRRSCGEERRVGKKSC